MREKKAPGRFTLQFNLEDPQQKEVSDLLEQQGRRKAQFLTSAVLCYIHRTEPLEAKDLSTIDKASLEEMLLAVMEKHPKFSSALSGGLPNAEEPPDQVPSNSTLDTSMGADAMAAISETLAAFQQG